MKKRTYILISIFLIFTFAILYIVASKKKDSPEYMPCPSLSDGTTRDVIIPEGLYYRDTAQSSAKYMKQEKRCVDAWVNNSGQLVLQFDQSTLESEYNRYYDELMKDLAYENSNARLEVEYDFSELKVYVNDSTTINNLSTIAMVVPGKCMMLRLLHGYSIEQADVTVIVIYEPSGKEILRYSDKDSKNINKDEWDKLIESVKQ